MTKEELAARLNGREYGSEISADEEKAAKAAGLVVLFGASDDLAELRGAINDEAGCYDGGDIRIIDGELFEEPDCDCKWAQEASAAAEKRSALIEALWSQGEWSWTYSTKIPHATFDVMEDGEPYCRGIVFALADTK